MTTSADRAFLLYGTTRTEPAPTELKAGWLTAKLVGGNLRDIRYKGIDVLRAISFLVRDRDWGTYDPALFDLTVEETDTQFTVRYGTRCDGPDGTQLSIAATITGTADGMLVFAAAAATPTGFETNRCGFCILHPIGGLAGTNVSIEHVDGRTEATRMPDLIEPWQPFKDMRAITHTVMPGITAECRMEGDTFEMEDQRNWSDASYKTYVRPLALPWPYMIRAGETVSQTITLAIRDEEPDAAVLLSSVNPVTLQWGEQDGELPAIGLVVTPEEARDTVAALRAHDSFGVQNLLLHFDPAAGHGRAAIDTFVPLAAAHEGTVTMEIAVPCQRPLEEEMQEIAAMIGEAGLRLDAIIVSPSVDRQSTPPGSKWPDCPPLEEVYAAAKTAFPTLALGGGMLSYFTEINRKRVPGEQLAFVSHATNPIVHAADDQSVMETLEALPFITRSLRTIYGAKAYRIGPSTIAMRQNPYGSRTMDNPHGDRIPMANRDPRHNGLFGAAFALGYAAAVTDSGLAHLTLSAATGPFGLIAGPGEPVPQGGLRPLAHVVRALASMAGWDWREVSSSRPGCVLALCGHQGKETVLLCANITAEPVTVDLAGLRVPPGASFSVLDETNLVAASSGDIPSMPASIPLFTLAAYGVARLGWH
ncbi:hypothetical protein LJR030_002312 [Rhizobium sp. LjRoot30]|uniref:D-apionate lactonase n=1 Tax=Rhizobium sp. LjRoot30 TaxID=3342320 RepID=UPI003ECD3A15